MSARRAWSTAGLAARQLRASSHVLAPAQASSSSHRISARPELQVAGQMRHIHPSLPALKKASHAKGKAKSRQEVEITDNNPFDADAEAQLAKVRTKMDKALEWARGVVWEGVERGRGRVSPALLDSVKVSLPDGSTSPLNNIASVTVRNNALFVEVWDHDATKSVEAAIHRSNLPGLSPQKIDNATLKIPISRPTVEQRAEILKNLHTTVEAAKNQVRLARNEGMKAFGGRGEAGAEDVQKLADEFGGELDTLMSKAKKEFEKA